MTLAERPIRAAAAEREALAEVERMSRTASHLRLEVDGEVLELPDALRVVLRSAALELLRGNSVAVIPLGNELTTKQAADVLNVSRPHLIQLLDRGELPFRLVGTHRRIQTDEVFRYRAGRTARRRAGLQRLADDAQRHDLYTE